MLRYSNPSRCGKYSILVLSLLAVTVFIVKTYEPGINLLKNNGPCNLENTRTSPEDILNEFYKMMHSLRLIPIVIEPGMVYNTLRSADRDLLTQKGFTVAEPTGNITVISIALIDKNNAKIEDRLKSMTGNMSKLFKYWAAETDLYDNDWRPSDHVNSTALTGHHFFQRGRTLIHGIVFYRRGKYLWHVGLPWGTPLPVKRSALTFIMPSAYEIFVAIHRERGNVSYLFYVPSQTTRFLMEIASSRFLECDLSRASELKESDMSPSPRYYTLVATFEESIEKLKNILFPRLKMFFIFAGTLLGWYRQCDIIPYTHDVDYGAFSSDIGDEEFWKKTFSHEQNPLKFGEIMGLPEKNYELSFRLYGWKVDLFFIYRNETMFWGHGHRTDIGYFFSYSYPVFQLCSGDLLGHKVLVPCNTEEVIRAEYGPDWMKPVAKWYYESNPWNMGERHFWTAEEKKRLSKV